MISLGDQLPQKKPRVVRQKNGELAVVERSRTLQFIYNAFYAWGITPLTVLYPPEVLSYEIRAVGMAIYTFATKLCGLFVAMVIPFGLKAIGYQFYFVNACFDVLLVVFVVILGLVIDLGGVPGQQRLGFHYWKTPGPFVEYIASGSPAAFEGSKVF